MVKLLIACALLGGCYEDRYTCTRDSQCDVEGGRCELDGLCTGFDAGCPTNRRYQHAGELSGRCFDDRVALANPCAGGQPAALPEGCIANVCERLPACCEVAWLDACAQLAQQECDQTCDTRIAIAGTRQGVTELWDVRWLGDRFDIAPVTALTSPLQWVGPAPGETEPRLAGVRDTRLVVGADLAFDIDPARSYQGVASAPFARDGRDTIAVTSNLANADHLLEIFEPALDEHRTFAVPGSLNLTWGEIDHRDGFVDAVVRAGGSYSYLLNLDGDDHLRQLPAKATSSMAGGGTPGAPTVRQLDWLDLDGDGLLDFAAFGAEIRVHHDPAGLRDAAEHQIDCDPPDAARSCSTDPEPNLEEASFGGAALPDPDRPSLVFSLFPGRKLFRAALAGDALAIEPLAFPGDSCTCTSRCDNQTCPGPDCTCTYDCDACVPIVAVVARDLDGDRRLDLIAIDARLALYTALAPGFAWSAPTQIPTTFTGNLAQIATSLTGAPR